MSDQKLLIIILIFTFLILCIHIWYIVKEIKKNKNEKKCTEIPIADDSNNDLQINAIENSSNESNEFKSEEINSNGEFDTQEFINRCNRFSAFDSKDKIEDFISPFITKNKQQTLLQLDTIYSFYYYLSNSSVTTGTLSVKISILTILSQINFTKKDKLAIHIASLAVLDSDTEIQYAGISCFDRWKDEVGIEVLNNIKTEIKWLDDYRKEVINNLLLQNLQEDSKN
jgi:hypothetical protein